MSAGRLRRWIRPTSGLPLVTVTLLAGIAIGVAGADLVDSSDGSDVSPGQLLVGADQRTLAGSLGSCSSGYLKVRETDREVIVTLHEGPSTMIVPGECAMESFVAHLRAPLGKRRLVDGITGATLPSFDGSGILRPGWLPDGFVHRYDTAILDDEDARGGGPGCVQVYTLGEGYDESIWITQQLDAVWSPPTGVAVEQVTVRGRPGQAVAGELTWTENGQLLTIQSHAYPYATLSVADLVRIADALS